MRPPLWTLFAIPVLGISAWFVFTHQGQLLTAPVVTEQKPAASDLICGPSGNDCLHQESTPHYDISVTYPKLTGARAAVVEREVFAQIEQFKKDLASMLTEEEKARLVQMQRKYEFIIEYDTYQGSGYTSYKFDIYIDTGGAHPNGFYKTIMFDTQKEVTLEDLFLPAQAGKPESNYLGVISQKAYEQVLAELKERTAEVTPEMEDTVRIGTSPSPETLQFYVIDGEELVFFFPPYQVAAYAAGSFEARIPLAELKDILK